MVYVDECEGENVHLVNMYMKVMRERLCHHLFNNDFNNLLLVQSHRPRHCMAAR